MNSTTTSALSTDSVQKFLHQIEAQLLSSDAYHQLLTALQTKLGGVAEEFQSLLSALSREAIQYTLHQLMGEAPIAVDSSPDDALATPVEAEPAADAQGHAPSPIAQTLSAQPPNRDEMLVQLGQKIRQTREARGLTLEQLHHQTYVPLHHLKALELGQLEKLPEDVFIRGFVRQIGKALNMNGVTLAASIPAPAQPQRVVPSWRQKAAFKAGLQLSPVHLYVGYAALMAGAVGGLTWISQPPQPDLPAAKPTPKADVGATIPAQRTAQVAAIANIAHPEMLPVR